MEILTIDELCAWLKLNKSQVYQLTRARGQASANPLPVLRLGGAMRFRKTDVEQWLDRCAGGIR